MIERERIIKLKDTIAKHFAREFGMPGEISARTGKVLYMWETEKGAVPFLAEVRDERLVVRHPSKDEPLVDVDKVYVVGADWKVTESAGKRFKWIFLEGNERPTNEIYVKERIINLLEREKAKEKRYIPLTAFFRR